MSAVGGSIESVIIDGREFPVAADAESNRKLGGTENETQPNGDGSSRLVKTIVSPMFDGLTLSCDDGRGDHEYLQGKADQKGFFPVSVTFASGFTYAGNGQVTGELQYSSKNSTCAVTLSGTGRFRQV